MPKYKLAIDMGATKTLAGVVEKNKVVQTKKQSTQSKKDKKIILSNLENLIEELIKEKKEKPSLIGLGIAGQVDPQSGTVLSTGNFSESFKNIKLQKILEKKFKSKVKIDNDVKCFVKAEKKYGRGKNLNNFIGLTFGTGIGGAIVMNDKFWRGNKNTAGEVGHMKIPCSWPGSLPKCGCGSKNCWESVASGKAWFKIHDKYNKKTADLHVVKNIVTGLLNLSYIASPESFILGGGLMEHPDMLPMIKNEFKKQAKWPWFKQIKVTTPSMGDEAILIGSLI